MSRKTIMLAVLAGVAAVVVIDCRDRRRDEASRAFYAALDPLREDNHPDSLVGAYARGEFLDHIERFGPAGPAPELWVRASFATLPAEERLRLVRAVFVACLTGVSWDDPAACLTVRSADGSVLGRFGPAYGGWTPAP